MLLGRQVLTDHGARVDLLALDEGGTLYVIELKRARTPREVVAQVLDYGSWACGLSAESLARIFESGPFARSRTFHTAFADQFDGAPPETINESHRLVIVASQLDDSTQRIVEYLLEDYGVPINAVFFRYFRDGESKYLGRSWLKDPDVAEKRARSKERKRTPGEWNCSDYYVMFGHDESRSWDDARELGYVSAGGGSRWSRPLQPLQPGARVFVHHPADGYVGVGRVLEGPVRISDFTVTVQDEDLPIMEVPLRTESIKDHADDPELAGSTWCVSSGNGQLLQEIFEWLAAEHGATQVSYSTVRDYVVGRRTLRPRPRRIPAPAPPGSAGPPGGSTPMPMSPAHLAVEHGDLPGLRDLLDAGRDVEDDSGDGWTPPAPRHRRRVRHSRPDRPAPARRRHRVPARTRCRPPAPAQRTARRRRGRDTRALASR
jgi:hypothetical protein